MRQGSGMFWGKLGLEYLQSKIFLLELNWHTTIILNGMEAPKFAASVVQPLVPDFLEQSLVVSR